jgi:hypothetical protein
MKFLEATLMKNRERLFFVLSFTNPLLFNRLNAQGKRSFRNVI